MKKIGLLIVLLLFISSCSNDTNEEKSSSDYYGKWTSIHNSDNWNMSYQFNSDHSVVKTLINENGTTTIKGTFEIVKTEQVTTFKITYSEYNMIISNCSSSLLESLIINKSGNLDDTAGMCDRYGEYKKVK